jgi:adenylate cyclase
MRLQMRAKFNFMPPTGKVVLLAVDEKSLATQKQWPFPRSVHGQLMEWLGKAPEVSPAVMSWDFVFTDEAFEPEMDRMFAAPLEHLEYPIVMGAFSTVQATGVWTQGKPAPRLGLTRPFALAPEVVASLPDCRGIQIPIVPLLDVTRFALLDADADADGVVRKVPMVVRAGDKVFPSLVLGTLMAYWKVEPEAVEIVPGHAVVLKTAEGDRRVPIDERGFYRLNYRYELPGKEFPVGIALESYQDVYESLVPWALFGDKQPVVPVAGKIVIVGETAAGLTDIGPSPLRGESAKVLVHINALENILRGDYLRPVLLWPGLAALLLAGVGASWILDRYKFRVYLAVVPALIGAVVAGAYFALQLGNFIIPLAVPLVAFGLQQAVVTALKIREEQAQRERIRRMFGSYVSPELVRRMVEARAEPQLGGHEDEITAFFSDIQGFSSFSEVLTPVDLVELLNEYLGSMTDILQEQGGALDKYIGDAIVAMFGGLLPMADHARKACETAARMQMRQAELRSHWQSQGDRWPPLVHAMRMRIGLHSGRVVVGNMGSRHRFNYTMMGDVVNLAARCESGAKSFGVYTLVTEETVKLAKAAGCACVFRALDRIVVKGKTLPVEVYELTALSPEHLPDGGARCLELFAEGRAHYLKQDWAAAIRCFDEAAALEPLQPERDSGVESTPSLLMRARCEKLREHPPGAGWDGVYKMTSK